MVSDLILYWRAQEGLTLRRDARQLLGRAFTPKAAADEYRRLVRSFKNPNDADAAHFREVKLNHQDLDVSQINAAHATVAGTVEFAFVGAKAEGRFQETYHLRASLYERRGRWLLSDLQLDGSIEP